MQFKLVRRKKDLKLKKQKKNKYVYNIIAFFSFFYGLFFMVKLFENKH